MKENSPPWDVVVVLIGVFSFPAANRETDTPCGPVVEPLLMT